MSKVRYDFEEYRVEKRPLGYVVTDCEAMFALGLNHKENAELVAKVLNDDNNGVSDVLEQKHGHWIRELFDGCVTLRCSCCNWSLQDRFENRLSEEVQKLDCCGECGAKMCEVTE